MPTGKSTAPKYAKTEEEAAAVIEEMRIRLEKAGLRSSSEPAVTGTEAIDFTRGGRFYL